MTATNCELPVWNTWASTFSRLNPCRIAFSSSAAGRARPKDYAHDQELEAYTLSTFGEAIKAGTVSMSGYEGQLFYAKANWNEALRNMRSARFEAALSRLAERVEVMQTSGSV